MGLSVGEEDSAEHPVGIKSYGVLSFGIQSDKATGATDGFRRLPGRLPLPLVSGYMCPVKPAIAGGRLFLRTLDKLVCYDLRARGE